jgi:DNA-directed RNA polymerase specialized sigma24 family protein
VVHGEEVGMFLATRTDAPCFEEFAAATWSALYRSAYLLAGNHADAEDLAQQTLIKAHRGWVKVSASDSPIAYVRRILTNTFLSSKRPKARRLELLTDEIPEWWSLRVPLDGGSEAANVYGTYMARGRFPEWKPAPDLR